VYSFGHFPVVAGIIGFAVAIEQSVAHPLDPLPTPAAIALVVGVGLFVGGVALALLLGRCPVSRWRLIALGLLAVAAPFLTRLPAWAALVVVALLVVGLAVVDRPLGRLESEAGGPLDGSQTA
jgi:low temperature requirement protein LtrA